MADFENWAKGIAGGDRTKIAVTTAHILALREFDCFSSERKLGGVLIELGEKAPPGAKEKTVGAHAWALSSKEVWFWRAPRGGSAATVKPQPASSLRSVAKQDVTAAIIKTLEKALASEKRKRKREEEGKNTAREKARKSKKKAKKANKRAEGAEAKAKDAQAALAASESERARRSLKRREEDVDRKKKELKAREAAVEVNEAKRGAVKKLNLRVKTLQRQQKDRAQDLKKSKDCTLQWEALPVLPLDKKLEAFKVFRGASPTKRCEELREKQIKQYDTILEELKEELKADAKALMEKLEAVRASKFKARKSKAPLELKAAKPPALKKNQDVWVVDTAEGGGNPEQRQDAEGTEVMIWPGKMHYKLNRQQISAMDAEDSEEDSKAEWYSISFDDCEACNYPRASIFVSYAEATVNLYIG